MFPVDQLHALLRHSRADHKRETIAFGRRLNAVMEPLFVAAGWKNFINGRSERRPDPAPAAPPPHPVLPLGGPRESGMNSPAHRYRRAPIVVDAGLMFPEEQDLGVDVVIPEFSWLFERVEEIRGIVLTHGHEDHIG